MSYQSLAKLFYSDKDHYEEIYQERFDSKYATKINFEINGSQAFFVLEPSLHHKIISIYKADKRIKKLRDELPGVAISHFTIRSLVDEIVLTNDIEGVYSSRREINSILSELETKNRRKRFKGLVQKYLMLQKNETLSFQTCQDIRNLYNELVYAEVEEDKPDNLPDGEIFRKDSASVTTATQKEIHQGVNPESKIIECMNQALQVLNSNEIDEPIKVALFHYLFGYIHPFYDGNGRTSRFISSYLLSKEFEPTIAYRLSYTIKENIKEYYQAFKTCNERHNRGDLTPFVIMFTDIIEESMKQLEEALQKRHQKLMNYRERIQYLPMGLNEKYIDFYDYLLQASLFSESGVSVQELMGLMRVSRPTVFKRLKNLSEYNLIDKKSLGNSSYYNLNLDEVEKLSSANTDEE